MPEHAIPLYDQPNMTLVRMAYPGYLNGTVGGFTEYDYNCMFLARIRLNPLGDSFRWEIGFINPNGFRSQEAAPTFPWTMVMELYRMERGPVPPLNRELVGSRGTNHLRGPFIGPDGFIEEEGFSDEPGPVSIELSVTIEKPPPEGNVPEGEEI